MSDPIALSVLALEIPGASADQLAVRHADAIVLDYVGRRCLPRDVAREVLEAHRAQRQQQADQRAEVLAEARRRGPSPIRRRIKALQERQQVIVDGDLSRSAIASMLADDHDDRMTASARRADEYLRGRDGGYTWHPIRTEVG